MVAGAERSSAAATFRWGGLHWTGLDCGGGGTDIGIVGVSVGGGLTLELLE